MDKIILGLLMIKQLTIYELRGIIETYFTSMCSNSMGSIQAAVKKLLDHNMIVYQEYVENSVNKKAYALTDAGKACFHEWVQTSMVSGKVKDMELSKFFFMGFVPASKRVFLIDAYLMDLKKEKEQLDIIMQQSAGHSYEESDKKDLVEFELLTLQFGIDRTEFEIRWFEQLKEKLSRGES